MTKLKNEILNRTAMNTIINLHKSQLASEEVFILDFTGDKPEIYTKKNGYNIAAGIFCKVCGSHNLRTDKKCYCCSTSIYPNDILLCEGKEDCIMVEKKEI